VTHAHTHTHAIQISVRGVKRETLRDREVTKVQRNIERRREIDSFGMPSTDNRITICQIYTLWCRVPVQKLRVTQLVEKFSTFYGKRWFITVFITTRHWSLCWARCIQSTSTHFSKIHSNIMFPSTAGSSEWPLPFRFSNQNTVRISHLPMHATCSTHIIQWVYPVLFNSTNI
jgi:hypothetical protein